MNHFFRVSIISVLVGIVPASALAVDISGGIALELRPTTRTFNNGQTTLDLWVFCLPGISTAGGCNAPQPLDYPGPILEIGISEVGTVTLDQTTNPTLIPNEPDPTDPTLPVAAVAAFRGHSIHFANLDLPQIHDGVPSPFPPTTVGNTNNTLDHTYQIDLGLNNSGHVGSHAYYCHVHQTKHVEMGEFGALIVRPRVGGVFVNTIGGVSYQGEAIYVLSTIDPNYHVPTAYGDEAKNLADGAATFATYNPQVFLVNGNEGASKNTPADDVTVPPGATITQVAIRLIGMHSVNATFRILGDADAPQDFVVHYIDGWAQSVPKTQKSVELSPGQTKDILVAMPIVAGTTWFPEVTYTHLRDDNVVLSTVFGSITIQ